MENNREPPADPRPAAGDFPGAARSGRPSTALAALLRSHRRAAGLTQEDVADRSGVSVRTISDLERGVYRTARKDTARLLAEVLSLQGSALEQFMAVARGWANPAPEPQRPSTLPLIAPLVGREALVKAASELVDTPRVRLLTVIGPAGVGKTSLAVAVGAATMGLWPEPTAFVALDGIRDAELVVGSVGRALGVRDGTEPDTVDALVQALGNRQQLLILDNFEHVIEAAPVVAALANGCPAVTVLVTSRNRLHLKMEYLLEVPALPIPPASNASREAILRSPAVQLFLQRVQASGVMLSGTDDQLVQVAEICRRLDGLPLALELAAARIRLLGLDGILAGTQERMDLLNEGPRDAPERQRALRAAIEWSYQLLTPKSRAMLEQVAVFAGGFTLEAVAAVSGQPAMAQIETMSSLVDASLVQHADVAEGGGRLFLLQTVRDYAHERLSAGPFTQDLQLRHAEYFADLTGRADIGLQSSDQRKWLKRLDDERDNVRAALGNMLDAGRAEEALRLAAGMWRYWEIRGDLVEGRRWLDRALALPGGSPLLRARTLKAAGNLARDQGDYAAAERQHDEALGLFDRAGTSADVAACLNNLGNVALDQGRRSAAAKRYEHGLRLLTAPRDEALIALMEHNLALAVYQREPDRAIGLLEQSLARQEALGDEHAAARTRTSLGLAFLAKGDRQAAATHQRAAALVQASLGDRVGLSHSLEGLAASIAESGQARRAARLMGAAEAIRELIGLPLTQDDDAYHRALAALRAGLDQPTLTREWAEGKSAPPRQSIEPTISPE